MAYYLVIKDQIFVDPHGSPDEGGSEKFITEKDYYLKLDGNYTCGGDIVEEEDLQGSEDGYNSEYEYYTVKEITAEQAEEYKNIIDAYNSLK
jgi:hypothetical protein